MPTQVVRSMTGFGGVESHWENLVVRIELRSVNHRHLQVKLRLPSELSTLESQVDAQVRGRLGRGAISGHIALEREDAPKGVQVDRDLARRYAEQAAELGADLGLAGSLSLDTLLQLPGIVTSAEADEEESDPSPLVQATLDQALDQLLEMREHEGAALLADLRGHALTIRDEVQAIAKRMPVVVQEHHTKLRERVADLIGDSAQLSPADLAREVAILSDRLDVSEETSRLDAHLEQLNSLLAAGGPVGRKLDFLVQEFLREANTIGSKCSDAKVAHHVVELKTHIERLREQVQNIE